MTGARSWVAEVGPHRGSRTGTLWETRVNVTWLPSHPTYDYVIGDGEWETGDVGRSQPRGTDTICRMGGQPVSYLYRCMILVPVKEVVSAKVPGRQNMRDDERRMDWHTCDGNRSL